MKTIIKNFEKKAKASKIKILLKIILNKIGLLYNKNKVKIKTKTAKKDTLLFSNGKL